MQFLGKVHPKKEGEKYHTVVIHELGIFTQGKDMKDCLRMAKDALESLLEITDVEVKQFGKSSFTVSAADLKPLMGRFLETLRENAGLSIREVSARLGKSSPNFYAQYEQGKSLPSVEMLSSFVKAMSPNEDVVITLKKVV